MELRNRLELAVERLKDLRSEPNCSDSEVVRLSGKIEGIQLAISYLDEIARMEVQ